jgi:hypothetical protein
MKNTLVRTHFRNVPTHVTRADLKRDDIYYTKTKGKIVRSKVVRKKPVATEEGSYQIPPRGWVKSKEHDKTFTALKPGRRKSKSGHRYYEHRADRSDKRPKVRL